MAADSRPGRVTVFGGSGFLGGEIVKRLVAEGITVRVAVRHPDDAATDERSGQLAKVEAVYADVRDETSVALAMEGSEAVVNAVGLALELGDVSAHRSFRVAEPSLAPVQSVQIARVSSDRVENGFVIGGVERVFRKLVLVVTPWPERRTSLSVQPCQRFRKQGCTEPDGDPRDLWNVHWVSPRRHWRRGSSPPTSR